MAAPMVFTIEIFQLLIALFIFIIFIVSWLKSAESDRRPPIFKGWIPWLGCAVEFGRSPLTFIDKKRKELGPVFTLSVAGERLTFLTEAEDFHHFFVSSNVDFQKAVQDSTERVACLSKKSFFSCHTQIHDGVKGKLAASQLSKFSSDLCHGFNENLMKLDKGEGDLMDLVRDTMYPAVINNLFGRGVLPINVKSEYEQLKKHFVMFDDQFEYGAKLPGFFLKEWSTSKHWLLSTFQRVVNKVQANSDSQERETILQMVCGMADGDSMASYSMLFLWASLANAIPITFWTLSFLLKHPSVLQKARQQVEETLHDRTSIMEADLRQMPYLKCCILEAIRLRSPGVIARRVVKPFVVKDKLIPEGDMLMVSPFWAHRNIKHFPDPEKYDPERWVGAEVEKNTFLPGFIAFGGGRYQCPGRWFALMEMQMYVALFLQRFDCKLIKDVPKPSTLHLVGTQQPEGPCLVQYHRQ